MAGTIPVERQSQNNGVPNVHVYRQKAGFCKGSKVLKKRGKTALVNDALEIVN
jgi:hypothetical protein